MSTLITPAPVLDTNPFVGPRSLLPGEPIHGRDREIRRLVNLLVAERLVLLYSPSGAGKTSLIAAGLIPRLRERRFTVSPVIRVSLRPPEPVAAANRYLLSTLLSLEAGLRPDRQRSPGELLALGLEGYLREWGARDDGGPGNALLIFDQFEEILLDPGDDADKREFFRVLGAALEARDRWALVSMREDRIAGLDPYLPELPTRLHTRLRLDLLSPDCARRAAERLAAAGGRPFQEAAVISLVDSLRRVQAQRDGRLVYVPGPVVEPLQLQVVCRRLWESLPADAAEITAADVERLGRVQDALADYYAQAVADVAAASGVPERLVRDWFGEQLVTEQGLRRQQQRGPGTDPARAEHAAGLLEDAHLIRSEERGGTRWLELAHDQLVDPIQTSNAEWRRRHLSTLQQRAAEWASHDRPAELLITGTPLTEARTWAAQNQSALTEPEHRFLAACAAADADQRRRRRNALLLRWLSVALALALVAAVFAAWSADQAQQEATARAKEAASRADAAEAVVQLSIDPERAVRTAARALATAPTTEAEDALRQALAQNPPTAVLAHGADVNSADFDQRGDRLVTAGWDGTARIWDTTTGNQLRRLPAGSDIIAVRFSPDGHTVFTLTEAGELALWRVDGPDAPLWRAKGLMWRAQWTAPVQFSHDGTRLLAVDQQAPQVKILDAATGTALLPPLAGHTDTINSVAFSPDDTLVLTASQDGTARVWDSATGQQLAVLDGHEAGAVQAAFRGDGRAIATSDGQGTVRMWRWPELTTPLAVKGQEHGPSFIAFDSAGHLLASGDKTPRLFDSDTGQPITELRGHRDWAQAWVSRDGSRAVTSSADGTARVWELPSGRELAVLRGLEATFARAAIDSGGDRIATINGTSVRLFQLPAQQIFTDFHDWALTAAPVNHGAAVAGGGQDGRLLVWNVAHRTVLAQLQGPRRILALDVDPTSQDIAAVMGDGTAVWVWDWQKHQVLARLPMAKPARDVSFDPTGSRLVVATDSSVQLIDWRGTPKSSPLLDDTSSASNVGYRAAFSPHGDLVAVARGTQLQLRTTSGELRGTTRAHTDAILSVAYSRDGRYLLTTSADGTARTWHADPLTSISTLEGHHGPVQSGAFDDSGRWVVTAGEDGYIGVWDVTTGRRLAWLPRHTDTDTVDQVRFTPGNPPRILSASDDTTVRLSDCETCQPLDQLRARADRLLAADQRVTGPPAVGQCFKDYRNPQSLPVDCRQEHRYELYAVITHPAPDGTPLPGDVIDWARRECRGQAYRDYRGKDSTDDPDYQVSFVGPLTSAEWDLGQRWFACTLSPRKGTTTGSARHTG